MEKKKRRILPGALMALGGLMLLAALFMLARTPQVLQYVVPAPEPGNENVNYTLLAADAREAIAQMGDNLSVGTVGGVKAEVSLSAGSTARAATLFAMGEGWLEVYPRFLQEGRRISETELAKGAKLIMLDEDLAFQLFGTTLPENAKVMLEGVEYAVAGTVRHAGSLLGGRGVGDILPYDCYVPLASLPQGMKLDTIALSGKAVNTSGAAQLFEETASGSWRPGGTMASLPKEAMRRTILPRVLGLIIGLYALIGLFRAMTALCGKWFGRFREALREKYIAPLIPRLVGILLLSVLGYGALIGLTWLLMDFSVQPLYVFTEWVPENIVSWSSLTKVFWNLTGSAAGLVRMGTRELRVIEFWGGLARWGSALVLTGAALRGFRKDYH